MQGWSKIGTGVRGIMVRMGLCLLTALPATQAVQAQTREGVQVGETSVFAKMVPADQVERSAALQYQQTLAQASKQHALGQADHPQVQRLRTIMEKITPLATKSPMPCANMRASASARVRPPRLRRA